jgi:hypothetical protein
MSPRPPDTVEHWPLDRLIPYARNARTHSEDQVAQIAASIVEFGWLNPVLVDPRSSLAERRSQEWSRACDCRQFMASESSRTTGA